MENSSTPPAGNKMSSIEFIIVTPEGQLSPRRAADAISRARQYAAKRYHAKENARRRGILLEALRCSDDQTSATPQKAITNKSETLDVTEGMPADKLPEKPGVIYQPEAALFGQLKLRKRGEKDDVVRYLQMIPSMATGASRNNNFQPVREVSIRAIQASPAVVDWLLLEIEGLRSITDPMLKTTMYNRRKRIYRTMNKMLADPTTCCSDELLNMVFAATCVEYRTGTDMDVANVRIHYRGLEKLIESRGGLASLFGFAATMSHPICCLPYLQFSELEVSGHDQAEKCCETFLEKLQAIQAFMISLGCSMTALQGNIYPNLKYLTHRKRQTDAIAERIAQFLSLYLIALAIWDFGFDNDIANKFFSRLSTIIDDRINPTTGATQLNAHMQIWMVVTTWVEIDASSTWPGSGQQKELWITQTGIDALKVFGRLSDRWKDDLTGLLADWVCAGCGDSGHNLDTEEALVERYVDAEYLAQITTACCSNWYEEYIASKEVMVNFPGYDD